MGWKWGIGAALALAAPVHAAAPWFEASSAHFRVYTPGSADAARALATKLERFDRAMHEIRGLAETPVSSANRLDIYMSGGQGDIERLCAQSSRRRSSCTSVAGFYNPGIDGSAVFIPTHVGDGGRFDLNAQVVLFHEYSHHIMFQNYATAYPAWFAEGFAEFNSTADLEDDGSVGFGKPAYHRFHALLAEPPLPMAKLFDGTTDKLGLQDRASLYARGWLLTHYLTFEDKRRGQLDAYLKAFAGGTLEAAGQAFGPLPRLDSDLDTYLHRARMAYAILPASKLPPGEVTVRQLGPGEAAMMPVRIRSRRGVDPRTSAQEVVADARRVAAAYPADPAVQAALAEAEFDAGNDDAAEAAVDRTLQARPDDVVALTYKGRIHARRAARAKAAPQVWTEARSWYLRANRLQNDAALPLYLFYCSFLAEHVRPTANAAAALERAFTLVPQDDTVRLLLARQMLEDNRLSEMREVLAPAAYDPHAPADNLPARLIGMIDAGQDAAALRKAWSAPTPDPPAT